MRAIEITQPGGPEALALAERPLPPVLPHQVLIKVAAAGINRPDAAQRRGVYPPPPGASDIPGLEIAGIIEALGENVSHLKIGEAVCALLTGGGYAEYCTASVSLCLPIPEGLDFIRAAALPETFFTVWSNVFDRTRLAAGETLLIHGGGSGIGTTAIQLANAFGARVAVTAGSDAKCEFCRQLGAAAAINYRTQDFAEEIRQLTGNKGVDMILDMIGGDYLPKNLRCLATEGRLVQIAIQHGAKAEIDLWQIMLKRLTLTGSTLRARDDPFKAQIARQLQEKVWPLLSSGKIRPVIDSVFDLGEAAKAHERLESGQHIGKIILKV
ncbi:NAD(P)H-quinone oxidoreductase [Methylomicrobium album]|uniref:Putative NAD(P)H quinone oxidoreductase, PIG3 family n=1 Tax=Methylomicrobium album BG8 TaxID=686340 RepID=H8GJQ0_METAL|nr:NAD(P)H-quinone oxidoreductase [Methylomicrobium album]EIC31579.1 putative NAD(P)H quinone oxidoreductase, PIG3 family [Methylomicrobium album BG8]